MDSWLASGVETSDENNGYRRRIMTTTMRRHQRVRVKLTLRRPYRTNWSNKLMEKAYWKTPPLQD
jgi:hypothetical protein